MPLLKRKEPWEDSEFSDDSPHGVQQEMGIPGWDWGEGESWLSGDLFRSCVIPRDCPKNCEDRNRGSVN